MFYYDILDQPLDIFSAFERKSVMKAGDIDIFVASLDDLITMKKAAGRTKDASDARMLEQAKILLGEKNES